MNHGILLGCLQADPGWQGAGKDTDWISLKRSAGSHKIASFMRKEGWDIDCKMVKNYNTNTHFGSYSINK